MTRDAFRRILAQIEPFTDYVYFHVKGEPLLHPELGMFLDLCGAYGFKVNLTTNGTLIAQAADRLLMKPALRQINFSLHSYDGNVSTESKDDYLGRIFSYIRQSVAVSETILSLRLWNLGREDVDACKAGKNHDVLRQIESAFELPYRLQEQFDTNRGIKLAEKVFLSQESEFEWPTLQAALQPKRRVEDVSDKGFCYGMRSHIAILVDGTVVPCCLDGEGIISLGNIYTTPFCDILQSPRAVQLHQGFSKHEAVEALCKKCTYRQRFN